MKKLKKVPHFKNETEERIFWQTHDTVDYLDWTLARSAEFPNLKPSTQTISLRVPEFLLNQIKRMANQRDIPYQSLMKIMLAEAVKNA